MINPHRMQALKQPSGLLRQPTKKALGQSPVLLPWSSAGHAPLLNAKEAAVTRVQMEDDQAKVLARVVSTGGSEMFYLFLLSKQCQGENTNCWMTDGVIGLQPADAGQPKIEI